MRMQLDLELVNRHDRVARTAVPGTITGARLFLRIGKLQRSRAESSVEVRLHRSAKDMEEQTEKLNVVIPQWQGGGEDLCTWYGAFALRDNYLKDPAAVTVEIGDGKLSPEKNHIRGYEDLLQDIDQVNRVLEQRHPARIFTLGGGCDADTPCAAWLNRIYAGDLAVIYLDAHGDLNTPETSKSGLYYGMSLRALLGESTQDILERLASTIRPDQLIMGAGRSLDPEEIRYLRENRVSAFPVAQLEEDAKIVAREVAHKGYQHVYLHVDFDCLDPLEFALTPVQEANGLKANTLKAILRGVRENGADIVGMAMTEYAGTAADRGNALVASLVSFGKEI